MSPPTAESDEKLNCEGEPVPGTVYVPPQAPAEQSAEEKPAEEAPVPEDYDELTPVTFAGAENSSSFPLARLPTVLPLEMPFWDGKSL